MKPGLIFVLGVTKAVECRLKTESAGVSSRLTKIRIVDPGREWGGVWAQSEDFFSRIPVGL